MSSSSVPLFPPALRPGTIIRARHRLWRVDRQEEDTLVATTIDGGESEQHRLYLGADPNGIPYEHIEPARLELPNPSRVGHIATQDLLLRAFRLSLLHGSAPLLSLQRTRVIPMNYQLVPVAMALEEPRVRLAIFDDVGLGKTIEAGLIVTELMARQLASRLLVICPANLREQWREQLNYFFHLDARIFSSTHRRVLERELPAGANPWEFYRCLIVSEDYAKEAAIRQQILEQTWDIVLIDEAHTLAKPHQSSDDDRVDMDRWHLAEALASSPRARHLLLLTATPHNGYSDSFASLLRMLDVGAIEGPPHAPYIHREIARKHICQRTRRDLRAWFEREGRADAFPQREQIELTISPSAAERAAIDAADEYGRMVLRDAEGSPRQIMASWTVMHLHKRALSSPQALRISLKNRRDALQRRLKASQDQADALATSQDTGGALSLFEARANALDNDPGERLSEEEAGIRVERGIYAERGDPLTALRAELRELERVIELAEKITPAQDTKLQWALRNELPQLLNKHPRVIIFSRYRDTMSYVADQIERSERFRDARVIRIEGSLSEQQRREAFVKFEKAAKAILVATDAISEGINLQHACCQMIHWELPWNPNRLEQRVGRIDRFGQPEPEVRVRLLVMDDTLDGWILKTLVQKAQQIRADYGFAPPYFGDETSILDLLREKGIRVSLLPRQLSLFERDTRPASSLADFKDPFSEQTLKQIQAESFYGATDVTVPDIERRLRETEAAIGSPADIQTFVQSGLQRFGCAWTPNPDSTVRVAITDPNLLVQGMDRVIEHATFNPQAALDDPELTLLDLGHPLVRRLMDVVKDSAFDGRGERYGRTAYLVTPDVKRTTALLHVLARYVVGTETPTIVEELIPVAYPIYDEGRLTQPQTEALLNAEPAPKVHADDDVREDLAEALRRPDLDAILSAAVEERRRALVADRQQMLRRDVPTEGTEQRRWLRGIDDLTTASYDVLTATIYYPPVG